MNIFKALSQGYGRLDEENMSAMLSFLLNPVQAHGMGDIFLRLFLELVGIKCQQKDRFKELLDSENIIAQVELEQPYQLNNVKRFVDIDIRLFTASDELPAEIHRIIIESKIHYQSARAEQFAELYNFVKNDLEEDYEDKPPSLSMIFLTPEGERSRVIAEYETLRQENLLFNDKKCHIFWNNAEIGNSIIGLILVVLDKEAKAEINPISDYMRHTLKAFVRFIIDQQKTQITKKRISQGEPSEPIDELEVTLSSGHYSIRRYQTGAIQIIDLLHGEPVVVKPILRQINQEKNLGVDLIHPETGNLRTSYQLGREVVKRLKEQAN